MSTASGRSRRLSHQELPGTSPKSLKLWSAPLLDLYRLVGGGEGIDSIELGGVGAGVCGPDREIPQDELYALPVLLGGGAGGWRRNTRAGNKAEATRMNREIRERINSALVLPRLI